MLNTTTYLTNTDYGDIEVPEGGSFDDMLALIGKKNIGEEMDKIIAKLAEANKLRGVIDNAHFNDEDKLGKGKEMVDKLTELLLIFKDQMPSFSSNRAEGDDIIGDAYEYLMKNFATESGKSKGQFYTPAEISRILAKVVGIEHATGNDVTLYDCAAGSGSLLIRAAEACPVEVAIYGQEKDVTTAGLARMNLVLHNYATAEVKGGYSTFSNPMFRNPNDNDSLRQFDFAVVNPPFSDKNWTHGLVDFGRFDGYGDTPPQKNGDFAWLMHILKSLKRNGKAAVILPHGVLFRGNAEATIRKSLIDKGVIKGIIGLPANLFFGTGIPACILVIDKENADERDGIFMIDASRAYVKDGNKNRLRERDVYKISTVFNNQLELDKYSRYVPLAEIKEKNAYNLNITRYIDGNEADDLQSVEGHLKGGIPAVDIESLNNYWSAFPNLKRQLFEHLRDGFERVTVSKDEVRDTIYNDSEFFAYADVVEEAFETFKVTVDDKLRAITSTTKPKELIKELAEVILTNFEPVTLIDKYDAYEVLLSYWNEVMSDDVYLIVQDGYKVIRDIEVFYSEKKKKDGPSEKKESGWEGRLIPKALIVEMFFDAEKKAVDGAELIVANLQAELDEYIENVTEEDDEDVVEKEVKKRKREIAEKNKVLKALQSALDSKCRKKYPELTDEQCIELLLSSKWYRSISNGIIGLYTAVCHSIADRVAELNERYEQALPQLENEVEQLESKIKSHLERMGFVW